MGIMNLPGNNYTQRKHPLTHTHSGHDINGSQCFKYLVQLGIIVLVEMSVCTESTKQ